jgi:hypothetical protein
VCVCVCVCARMNDAWGGGGDKLWSLKHVDWASQYIVFY